MSDTTTQILTDRGKEYGSFQDLADIAQALKTFLREQPGWANLDNDMREALDVDATKTARILNGNPRHLDSWDDKAGYARLVADRLREGRHPLK